MEHETACEHKPAQPAAKRKKTREEADNDAGPDDQEEEESDEDEDDDEEEEIEIEDVFLSNFAFILVLLRAYVLEFVDYDEDRVIPDNLNFEYLLVFLLCAWLYHSWQENGFHLMLDETSPFMAAWFMSLVLMMMMLKAYFVPWTSPDRMTAYLVLVAQLKPALTLLTGVFSCSVHCFVHQLWREENVFVLSCVLAISLALSSIEIFWSLQVRSHLQSIGQDGLRLSIFTILKLFISFKALSICAGSDGSIILQSVLVAIFLHCSSIWSCGTKLLGVLSRLGTNRPTKLWYALHPQKPKSSFVNYQTGVSMFLIWLLSLTSVVHSSTSTCVNHPLLRVEVIIYYSEM